MEREAHAHLPVLVDEVTFLLRPRRGGWVVDGTIGMGGHAERLLDVGGAETSLLGIDGDPEALARAGERLARFGDRVTLQSPAPPSTAPSLRLSYRLQVLPAPMT